MHPRPLTSPDATHDRGSYRGLLHAGAGTGLALMQLSAIIPPLLPTLILLGALTAVILLPLLALGLVSALVMAPPYAAWRLATARRRRRLRSG